MEVEVEFTLGNLEYSYILPDQYTWNDLEKLEFTFQDGWRVPRRSELIELFESEEKARDSSTLWSSSAYTLDNDNAWCVYFYDGLSSIDYRTYSSAVRLVREINTLKLEEN